MPDISPMQAVVLCTLIVVTGIVLMVAIMAWANK